MTTRSTCSACTASAASTGTLLTGVFAVGGAVGEPGRAGGSPGLLEGNPQQVLIQLYGIVVTLVWSGVLTFVLLKVIALLVPLRVTPAARESRVSTSRQHGEALQ